jgi:hypothetical protein
LQRKETRDAQVHSLCGSRGRQRLGEAAQQGQLKGAAEEGTDSVSEQVQQQQGAEEEEGTKVTGIVTAADTPTKEITIDGETYVMPAEGGGASLFPQIGTEVTLYYEEQGDQKVVTRIGQAEE